MYITIAWSSGSSLLDGSYGYLDACVVDREIWLFWVLNLSIRCWWNVGLGWSKWFRHRGLWIRDCEEGYGWLCGVRGWAGEEWRGGCYGEDGCWGV